MSLCLVPLTCVGVLEDTDDNALQGTGASWFVIAMLGWYLLLIQLLSTMNIPVSLPVGDLTHFWDRKPKHVESEA